jgi:alkylation response protein AidB-like acyl-CoA dehydrogenase
VRIPKENVLGRPGSGFAFIANHALDHGRYSIAWAGVAIAQEALDEMLAYAAGRKQFGRRIAEFQLIQRMLANALTHTLAARTLCLKAGEKRAAGEIDAVANTLMAKYFSSKTALKVATDAVQIHGGSGCSNDYSAERLFREAKVLEIIEGTSQICQQLIAKHGLRAVGNPTPGHNNR